MRKFFLLLTLMCSLLYAEEKTAFEIASLAVKKGEPTDVCSYLIKEMEGVTVPSEKRALYAFLGNLQETLSLYPEATASYMKACAIEAGDSPGMSRKSNELLVLDAIRCCLSSGDTANARKFLASSVKESKDETVRSHVRLYNQWAQLCNMESYDKALPNIASLKGFLTDETMKEVRPVVALMLWYMTGENEYAVLLNKDYPLSPEASITKGEVKVMPSPFWYFIPRKGKEPVKTVNPTKDSLFQARIAVRQQLGMFKSKENADRFVSKIKTKGFKPYSQFETRSNGASYYLVYVDENADGNMGDLLKASGFDCYPIF